jgi:diguanylate cyclase (GGDEF)-like protein/PAS domain S-box-containing protein
MPIIFILVIAPIATYNQNLFHTVVELSAVFIGIAAFIATLSTFKYSKSSHAMFIGAGYLCIAILDLVHLLTSMEDQIPNFRHDATVQFWLAARFVEALTLALFMSFIDRRIKPFIMISSSIIISLSFLFLVKTNLLPILGNVDGSYTPLVPIVEYVTIAVTSFAFYRLLRFKKQKPSISPKEYRLLLAALFFTLFANILFSDPMRTLNVPAAFGQFAKLLSFWMLYLALVENTLTKPFAALLNSFNTYNHLPDAITIVNESGEIVQSNASVSEFTTEDEKTIIGLNAHDLFHEEHIKMEDCPICHAIIGKSLPQIFEVTRKQKRLEINISAAKSEVGGFGVVHICHDMTQRHMAEQNLRQISRLFNMLRLTNQSIFKQKDELSLLQEFCDIAISAGEFELAWFGTVENNEVVPLTHSGDHLDFIQKVQIRLDDDEKASGPIGLALKNNDIFYVNNMDTDPIFKPWRENAKEAGFKSVVVMPWERNGSAIGFFALYASEYDAFDKTTIDLVKSLSNDISQILAYIDTERTKSEAEKRLTEITQAIEQSKSAIVLTDVNLKIEYVNEYFCRLNRQVREDMIGKYAFEAFELREETKSSMIEALEAVNRGESWEGEIYIKREEDYSYWAYQNAAPVFSNDGEMIQIIWTSRDNTELHNAQETISQLAFYDTLTELPNRRLFYDRTAQTLQFSKRNQTRFALLFFDIDDFKTVNDVMGHSYGDLLLKHMAKVLKTCVRDSDTVARLGGDEFTITLQDIKSEEEVKLIASKIISSLNKPAQIGERLMSISTSIGVSIYPTNGNDASTLMKTADMAMYHAKSLGKNTCALFDDSIAQENVRRAKMQESIKNALAEGEFSLNFQPQYDVAERKLIGVEALLRWCNSEGQWIGPDQFIDIAEQSDLIIDIDQWVVSTACHQMKSLFDQGFPEVKLAVNVSAVHFKYSQYLINTIESALSESKFPPHLLQIEMTESSLVEDGPVAVEIIKAIKSLGVSIAIDDFGTGYSSLAYLKRFPLDLIKIDRSFMFDIETDNTHRSIVHAIINMAHSLNLNVLAEGVETQRQWDYLAKHQCDFIQGYLLAKPMKPEDLYNFWKQSNA